MAGARLNRKWGGRAGGEKCEPAPHEIVRQNPVAIHPDPEEKPLKNSSLIRPEPEHMADMRHWIGILDLGSLTLPMLECQRFVYLNVRIERSLGGQP